MRLIDADAYLYKGDLENEPTIDAEPIKHGKWIAQDETYTRFRCSACGSENHSYRWEYCCKCGAKMDGE